MRKESPSRNMVVGSLEFEEEKLTWTQRTKLTASARLPEIDLINVREMT